MQSGQCQAAGLGGIVAFAQEILFHINQATLENDFETFHQVLVHQVLLRPGIEAGEEVLAPVFQLGLLVGVGRSDTLVEFVALVKRLGHQRGRRVLHANVLGDRFQDLNRLPFFGFFTGLAGQSHVRHVVELSLGFGAFVGVAILQPTGQWIF